MISIDWRGHGLSSKTAEMSLAADDLLEDVRQLPTALRLDNVVTVGGARQLAGGGVGRSVAAAGAGHGVSRLIMTQPEPAFLRR
ncbi:alpha/beta hydrolase [Serratia ureilytica]